MGPELNVAPWIECPECGGRASLLTLLPDDPEELEPGDVVAYRCADCLERFDVVVGEVGEAGEPG